MHLCKREECENEKLRNSAYCLSCHKEVRKTNNLVDVWRRVDELEFVEQQHEYVDELHRSMLGVTEILRASHAAVVKENREMMKILHASMSRMAEVQSMQLRSYQKEALKAYDADRKVLLESNGVFNAGV